MRIEVWSAGDPCAGNTGGFATVVIQGFEEWGVDHQSMLHHRGIVREALKEAFQEIFDDGAVVVVFEDEKHGVGNVLKFPHVIDAAFFSG